MLTDYEKTLRTKVYDAADKLVAARRDRFMKDWKKTHKRDKLRILFGNGTDLVTVNDQDIFDYPEDDLLSDFMDDVWIITEDYILASPKDINYEPNK